LNDTVQDYEHSTGAPDVEFLLRSVPAARGGRDGGPARPQWREACFYRRDDGSPRATGHGCARSPLTREAASTPGSAPLLVAAEHGQGTGRRASRDSDLFGDDCIGGGSTHEALWINTSPNWATATRRERAGRLTGSLYSGAPPGRRFCATKLTQLPRLLPSPGRARADSGRRPRLGVGGARVRSGIAERESASWRRATTHELPSNLSLAVRGPASVGLGPRTWKPDFGALARCVPPGSPAERTGLQHLVFFPDVQAETGFRRDTCFEGC